MQFEKKETGQHDQGIQFWRLECGAFEGKEFVAYWANDTSGHLKRSQKAVCFTIDKERRYEAMIDINNIESLTISARDNYRTVIMSLGLAPKIYERPDLNPGVTTLFNGLSLGYVRSLSYRDITFPAAGDNIARVCLTYRFLLTPDVRQTSLKHDLQLLTSHWVHIDRSPGQHHLRQLYFKQHSTSIEDTLKNSWSFSVRFQVQALWMNSLLSPNQLQLSLPHITALCKRLPDQQVQSIIRRIALQLKYADRFESTAANAVSILKEQESSSSTIFSSRDDGKSSKDGTLIHRVSITPAGIYLEGPEEFVANRVLRKFRNHKDCFLRVTFGEEDEGRMEFGRDVSNERILRGKFLGILDKGLDIAGEHFEFLGFSHSSLRAQSCWFMRPFEFDGDLLNARTLIGSLGDFSSIRCPAKCAARIGQAFSETQSAVHIDPGFVKKVPDIKSGRFLFTDGCGTISPELWKTLKRATNGKHQPTLYQIRYQGAKGMISLSTKLTGKQLLLRPSMIKFEGSPANEIEICGTNSRPLPFTLNRQLVKILEDRGVTTDVFLDLQADAVETLRNSTTSKRKAVDFISNQLSDNAVNLPTILKVLLAAGVDITDDTFLRDILGALLQVQLREIKYRTRILVPGALTLYGIADEFDHLAEGEIFVTISKSFGTDHEYLTRQVAVTRSPALHPGDVQVVQAVAPPEDSPLWDLTNCVVFSSKGDRDLPSMLSGGDLDGDLFNIIYDQRLLPTSKASPAEYLPVKPVKLDRPVQASDMTKFFVDFMQNDQLGRIATLHQVFADRAPGTFSIECLLLAELHSTAVDFSKSGVPVNHTRIPRAPNERPDFISPSASIPVTKEITRQQVQAKDDPDTTHRFKYYESSCALGQLYRAVDEDVFFEELEDDASSLFSHESSSNVLEEVWLRIEEAMDSTHWQHHITTAEEVRNHFEYNMIDIMSQYAPARTNHLTEKEVFIGTIIGKAGANNRVRREQSDLLKARFNRDVRNDQAWMREIVKRDDFELLALAVACLHIAVKKPSGKTGGKHGPVLQSFGWFAASMCVPELLGE